MVLDLGGVVFRNENQMIYFTPGIRLTHLPTGLVAYVREPGRHSAPTKRTNEAVRDLLRAKLAKLKEDPTWKESGGWYLGAAKRIRSWHLHTYLGVPRFVKDERTGSGRLIGADKTELDAAQTRAFLQFVLKAKKKKALYGYRV